MNSILTLSFLTFLIQLCDSQTIPEISQHFQSLLSGPQTNENDYSKLLTSIEKYAAEKSRESEEALSTEEKKLLNQITAAAVSRLLIKVSKNEHQSWEDSQNIQERIESLEQNLIPISHHVSEETSKVEAQMTELIHNLQTKISNLQASLRSNNLSSEITRTSKILSLNLLHIYACIPTNRFKKIRNTVQVSGPLRFVEIETSNNSIPDSSCSQSQSDFLSTLLGSVGAIIEAYPEHTQTLRQHQTNLGAFKSALLFAFVNLSEIVTAASELESAMKTLTTDLETQPELRNVHHAATFYELRHPNCTTSIAGNPSTNETLSKADNLRNLRMRLYKAINSSAVEQTNSVIDEGTIRDTIAGIQSCEQESLDEVIVDQLKTAHSQLARYKYLKYISDILTNLNTTQANEVHITNETLQPLSTLAEQTIKSSFLRIEYNKALNLKQDSSPPTTRIKSYMLTLTESQCSPDNYIQQCYMINGQFPGPPILVNQYDTLRVTVINRLQVATTIHFHGILQKHTVASDGVAHVTQDPIKPNSTYVYEMNIGEQTGTFMYHGHVGLDLVWLHGALIVRENPEEWKTLGPNYAYDDEHTFLLEEIFHESFDDLINGMINDGVDDPHVSSFAINGMSYSHWPTNQGSAQGYQVVTVTPGKTYRFRVINMASGSMLRFTIERHNMTIIEMDGIVTERVVTDRLELHTGQRYSILVTMDEQVDNYWIQARLMGDEGGADNGRAILHYKCAEDPTNMRTRVFKEDSPTYEITGEWILDELMPSAEYKQKGVYNFPEKSDRQILIDMQMVLNDKPAKVLMNGHMFSKPNTTYLESVRNGNDLMGETHVFPVKEGEVIDLIFQNRVDDTGGCDEHPIHIHGHSFWVVAAGADEVDMSTIESHLSQKSGNGRQFRDTFSMFPNSTVESEVNGTSCGWAVIRFIADNPGLWLGHCHVTSHMILGKMFVLYEYSDRNRQLINA